ncbi:MAG: ThiF family adenylyltransferase [Gemmatimonadetes bacterium]|nr:ThiF family adenylyltransferase [Gemmatimonadota bacterium]
MRKEVALTDEADQKAKAHLLNHLNQGITQENICFGLWYPSQGAERYTAIVNELVLPKPNEVQLHGNASFEGKYLTRATREAKRRNAGLVMMHSHPTLGWQALSQPDIIAERDIVAYQAQSTKKPFVGMTIGKDGCWSARFWSRKGDRMELEWCNKVRVPRKDRYQIDWNPSPNRSYTVAPMLQRSVETWGIGVQKGIQQLRIGIVGVGSVGAIVAETLARIGVSEITLIDPDRIEIHNLDRFIYGTLKRVGELKVRRVKHEIERHSTNEDVRIRTIDQGVEYENAYTHALDCDLLISCVDRPVPRDVLNYIAIANVIPVIDAGIAVEVNPTNRSFESARWRSHLVVPGNACLRCTGQYSSSDVVTELDGSLDDPSYIRNLPESDRPRHQNVFPFSLGCASMQVNLMVRYLIAEEWWPRIQRQEYRFIGGQTKRTSAECRQHCSFRKRQGFGSDQKPTYLKTISIKQNNTWINKIKIKIGNLFSMRKP